MNYKKYSNIKNETTSLSLNDLFGLTDTTEVSKNNALRNSDIAYSCINYISSTLAKMPISLYKEEEDGDKIKVNNELSYLIKNRPNPYMSRIDFIQTMVSNMLIHGNSFAKVVTRKGQVYELVILEPSNTRLEKINNKWCVITNIDNKQETLNYNQVIHLKDLSTDGVNGISRIEAIKMKLNNKANSDKMLAEFISNGGAVKAILSVNNKAYAERENIKNEFNNMLSNNKSKVAVVPDDMKFTNVDGGSLADAEFINNLKITKEDVMAIFNINPALLGMSEKATNSNMIEMIQEFVQSLIPLINKIEMELNHKLLSSTDRINHFFKFNMSSAMRGSDKDRADYYNKMIAMGALSINEIRELEDRNKVEGGDEYYRSLNYVPLSIANEYQLSKAGSSTSLNEE